MRKIHLYFPKIRRVACGRHVTLGFAGTSGAAIGTENISHVTCEKCLQVIGKRKSKNPMVITERRKYTKKEIDEAIDFFVWAGMQALKKEKPYIRKASDKIAISDSNGNLNCLTDP